MMWLIIPTGYILGSIPSAYIMGRLLKGKDIRKMGDGNVGMQNAVHQLGRKAGIIVGIIDIGKGSAVIYLAQLLHSPLIYLMAAGLAALAGHNWPVWIGFRGGRGICIIYGMLLLLVPQPLFIVSIPAGVTLALTRNYILALAVIFLPLPFLSWFLHTPGEVTFYSMFLLCIAAATHFMRSRNAINSEPLAPKTKTNPGK